MGSRSRRRSRVVADMRNQPGVIAAHHMLIAAIGAPEDTFAAVATDDLGFAPLPAVNDVVFVNDEHVMVRARDILEAALVQVRYLARSYAADMHVEVSVIAQAVGEIIAEMEAETGSAD